MRETIGLTIKDFALMKTNDYRVKKMAGVIEDHLFDTHPEWFHVETCPGRRSS